MLEASVDDIDKPVLTEDELWGYLHFDEGLPVTRRSIKHAVIRREIIPTRLGNCNFFSKRDGLAWITSRRQTGTYRVAKPAVAR